MVGAEVGKSEEESADRSGPESVAFVRIDRKINRLQFAEVAGDRRAHGRKKCWDQSINHHAEGDGHSGENDHHLVALRQTNDGRSADDGVNDHETAGEPDGQVELPSENGGKNDRGRIDRDPGGDAALHEKEKRAQHLRFSIESLAEILVGRENFQLLINRHEYGADHEKRERLTKIILDETDAALVSLARHGEKSDRPGLGRENRESDSPPADRFIALEIMP